MNSVVSEAETENQSLKDDLKRCELEARELNTQLDTMKLDYEQLVHDRDQEISLVTSQLEQTRLDLDIVLGQRDQAKDDLMGCHKQLDLLQARVDEHERKSSKYDLVQEKQVSVYFKFNVFLLAELWTEFDLQRTKWIFLQKQSF